MNNHPKAVGDRSTLAVMAALEAVGMPFLLPFGENTRYDLVLELGNDLARVQCKTGRLRNGAVRFRTSSSYAHHANPKHTSRDYIGEVDYFAVYCPETSGVYLIPIDQLPTRHRAALRIEMPETISGDSSASPPTTRSPR
jgi:PD-(D/E)XK endonuclease